MNIGVRIHRFHVVLHDCRRVRQCRAALRAFRVVVEQDGASGLRMGKA